MAKDYKDAPAARTSSPLAHPMLLGMIIGLLLGVVISLAVALWLNRLNNPFVEKGKAIEPLAKIGATQPPPPPDAAKTAEKAAEKAKGAPEAPKKTEKEKPRVDRPRFEFYTMLPGEKEVTEREVKAAARATPPPPVAPKAGSSPSSPKPFSGEIYWLQAGAFGAEGDADNLKAKIAMVGLEANVRPVNIPDKGTLYRVRLGPYQSVDAANRIKSALSQNGVTTAIIRTTDEPKKE